eukprot:scaffold421377_cov55-Attheya_sp.AAC.7
MKSVVKLMMAAAILVLAEAKHSTSQSWMSKVMRTRGEHAARPRWPAAVLDVRGGVEELSAVTESTTTAVVMEEPKKAFLSPKMASVVERSSAAIIMLTAVCALVKKFKERGMVGLILLIQVGMYYETTAVMDAFYNPNVETTLVDRLEKWWWFATVIVGTSGRALLPKLAHVSMSALELITYGMGAIGLLGAVVGMASHVQAGPDMFRSYLAKLASSHFALLFLVGQSSFWILTIQEFGMEWVLFPALLVIINDTMAYVFGMSMGRHKLLPRLSPKKTVEGFVGAAFSTVAMAIPLLHWVTTVAPENAADMNRHALLMAAFTSIVSPFGGFLASAVKRAHNAKDFGTLIPGHGGVVDRFDCQVVTAPFVFLYLRHFLK